MAALIDLHCHSTVSDGLLTPPELVAHAAKRGVRVLALTDHDDIGGLNEARQAAQGHDVAFINGVEISVTWKRRTLHIVGLKFDAQDEQLKGALDGVRLGREQRAVEMAAGLAKVGIPNAYEGAKTIAKNAILTRSHFAQFLVQEGHAKNVRSVFKKFLVKGKPGFVDFQWMSLEAAVGLIRGAGGVAVIAHPGRYDLGMINMHLLMHEFRHYGGSAIEVVTGSHTPAQYPQFAKIAHRFDLMASQGSDYHGSGLSYMEMGCLPDLPAGCMPIWQHWEEARYLS